MKGEWGLLGMERERAEPAQAITGLTPDCQHPASITLLIRKYEDVSLYFTELIHREHLA